MDRGWGESDIEHVGCCPLCSSTERATIYSGVDDWFSGSSGTWDYYECVQCGAIYIDPRPSEAAIGRLYENYFTHKENASRSRGWVGQLALGLRNDYLNTVYGYHAEPSFLGGRYFMYVLPPWLRWEWDHNARHLPKPELGKDRLLDVGCGGGDFLVNALQAGWKCQGVDFDFQAVSMARSRGLKVSQGLLAEQEYPDESFDVITLSHVIEHVHDPKALIHECWRILKPKGVLWVATPNVHSIYHKVFGRYWFDICPQHLVLFSPENISIMMQEFGMSVALLRRGNHAQSHWRSCSARRMGLVGFEQVCLPAFTGSQTALRYQFLELLTAIYKRWQGDIVVRAIKVA